MRGSPSPAWAGTISKVSAALEQRFPAQLPAPSQSKGKWSLCPASLNPSAVPWFSTARDSLMQKKLCPWSFCSPHSELDVCPSAVCLVFPMAGKFGMGWSTATGPSQAADVINNPPLGKWDPWHWCFAVCQCARAWDGDEKTSWEQKKQQSFNWEKKKNKSFLKGRKIYVCLGCFSIDKSTQNHSKSGFRVKCPFYYRFTVNPWALKASFPSCFWSILFSSLCPANNSATSQKPNTFIHKLCGFEASTYQSRLRNSPPLPWSLDQVLTEGHLKTSKGIKSLYDN